MQLLAVDQARIVAIEPKEYSVPILLSAPPSPMTHLDVSVQPLKLLKIDAAAAVRVENVHQHFDAVFPCLHRGIFCEELLQVVRVELAGAAPVELLKPGVSDVDPGDSQNLELLLGGLYRWRRGRGGLLPLLRGRGNGVLRPLRSVSLRRGRAGVPCRWVRVARVLGVLLHGRRAVLWLLLIRLLWRLWLVRLLGLKVLRIVLRWSRERTRSALMRRGGIPTRGLTKLLRLRLIRRERRSRRTTIPILLLRLGRRIRRLLLLPLLFCSLLLGLLLLLCIPLLVPPPRLVAHTPIRGRRGHQLPALRWHARLWRSSGCGIPL